MLYTNNGYVFSMSGKPVATDASPLPPKNKTLWLDTEGQNGYLSASAFINGSTVPAAVWSSHGNKASAEIILNENDTYVVVAEATRPSTYSSTIAATGYSTSAPLYTNSSVIVSASSTYSGTNTATLSAKYSGGQMVVSGTGTFYATLNNPTTGAGFPYSTPLCIKNEVSAEPAANLAYSYTASSYVTAENPDYSGYLSYLNIPNYQSLRISASAGLRTWQGTAGNSKVYARLYQFGTGGWTANLGNDVTIYSAGSQEYVFSGNVTAGHGTGSFRFQVIPSNGASASVNYAWFTYSGVLK